MFSAFHPSLNFTVTGTPGTARTISSTMRCTRFGWRARAAPRPLLVK